MTAQSNITPESIVGDLRYLQLLSRSFPTIADASTEIINLEAILNLPKGTEHSLTHVGRLRIHRVCLSRNAPFL